MMYIELVGLGLYMTGLGLGSSGLSSAALIWSW